MLIKEEDYGSILYQCPERPDKSKKQGDVQSDKRQLICFGLAALIGVPSFFLLKTVVKVNTAVMGMMVIMMPFFFLAMYEKNGQPLEVILSHMIQAIFKRPKIRPYMTDNYYDALLRQAKAEKEVENIVRFSQKKEQENRKFTMPEGLTRDEQKAVKETIKKARKMMERQEQHSRAYRLTECFRTVFAGLDLIIIQRPSSFRILTISWHSRRIRRRSSRNGVLS